MLFRINLPFTLAVTNAVIVTNSYHNAVLKPVGDMVVTCFYFFYFFCFAESISNSNHDVLIDRCASVIGSTEPLWHPGKHISF